MDVTDNSTYFCELGHISKTYSDIHGWLSFLVCVFGSVANVLNICVLTTKEMRSPTNLILTGLAVADLLVMIDYIPFTFHRYLSNGNRKYVHNYTYNWATFTIFHALFSQVFHFVSCCLTVVLAIWRYITIRNSNSSRIWCKMRITFYVIVATYLLCPIICAPLYVSLKIVPHNQTCDLFGRILDRNDLANHTGPVQNQLIFYTTFKTQSNYKHISFLIYSVVIKLIPCILLTYLSFQLIRALLETKRRKKLLLNANFPMGNFNNVPDSLMNKKVTTSKQADRTSTMLLAVLLLFLITEFPQAILGLFSALLGEEFEKQCYTPLGDLMDILALTNSAINFILYCTMSRQFRLMFRKFFQHKFQRPNSYSIQGERTGEKTQLTQM